MRAKKKRNNRIFLCVVIAAALFIMISAGGNKQSSRSRYSYSGTSTSARTTAKKTTKTSSKTTAKTNVKTTVKPAGEPATVSETQFTASSALKEKVYIDIVSIFPSYYIIQDNSSYYRGFVCKCETITGETAWVYVTAPDYKNEIDDTISLIKVSKFRAKTIRYNPSARIHGTVVPNKEVSEKLPASVNSTRIISFKNIDIPEQNKAGAAENSDTGIRVSTLTVSNIGDYLDIKIEQEKYENNKLTLAYTIAPKSDAYVQTPGSSSDITIRFAIDTYLTETSRTPFKSKSHTVILKKSKGYKDNGTITVDFNSGHSNVIWKYSVDSCSGRIGR